MLEQKCITSQMLCSGDDCWVVIGGGPCGMGSVARLLDHGVTVKWVDSDFSLGRMGQYYENVPSNTTNGDLLKGFNASPSLGLEKAEETLSRKGKLVMSQLEHNTCYSLGVFVDTLREILPTLMGKVSCIRGTATSLMQSKENRMWTVCIDQGNETTSVTANAVLVCCGAAPNTLPSLPCNLMPDKPWVQVDGILLHSLDLMVNPEYVNQLGANRIVDPNSASQGTSPLEETWAVVGNSHSAMLVIKNLYESGVQRIVNFHRSEAKFMHTTAEGWLRYQGIGLKGPVGAWAKQVYATAPTIEKIRISADDDIKELLQRHRVLHCVVAIGFGRDLSGLRTTTADGTVLTTEHWDRYDRMTGEVPLPPPTPIDSCEDGGSDRAEKNTAQGPRSAQEAAAVSCSGLFGGGIAFPQDLVDGGGNREPWVGFKRSIEQVDLMVAAFRR